MSLLYKPRTPSGGETTPQNNPKQPQTQTTLHVKDVELRLKKTCLHSEELNSVSSDSWRISTDAHLFERLLFALAELLVLEFPLAELGLQPLDALTQSQFVSGENTDTPQTPSALSTTL